MSTNDLAQKILESRFMLLGLDFDGTIAETFKPSPNNIAVSSAYKKAIEEIWGATGVRLYQEIGGLQNRATGELVWKMLESGEKERMIYQAKQYYNKHREKLSGFVPKEKGVPLAWDDQSIEFMPVPVIIELLVRLKLSFMMGEIGSKFSDGSIWPQPCQGFIEFMERVEELNKNKKFNITLAILSSGHQLFIEKTFGVWHLPCPPIMITDDDCRNLRLPAQTDLLVKPDSLLIDLMLRTWLQKWGIQTNQISHQLMEAARKKTIYVGDDPQKDGGLAANADVKFGLFDQKIMGLTIGQEAFSFSEWGWLEPKKLFDLI